MCSVCISYITPHKLCWPLASKVGARPTSFHDVAQDFSPVQCRINTLSKYWGGKVVLYHFSSVLNKCKRVKINH